MSTATLPSTWAQLDELMLKLTKKTGADSFEFVGGLPHTWQGWQYVLPQANGAKLISDDGKKAQLDSAEVVGGDRVGQESPQAPGHVRRGRGVAQGRRHRRGQPDSRHGDRRERHLRAEEDGGQHRRQLVRGQRPALEPQAADSRSSSAPPPSPAARGGPRDTKVNVYAGGILEVARKGGPKLDLMWEFMKYTASKEGGLLGAAATPRTSAPTARARATRASSTTRTRGSGARTSSPCSTPAWGRAPSSTRR